jgi:hypothetical protein
LSITWGATYARAAGTIEALAVLGTMKNPPREELLELTGEISAASILESSDIVGSTIVSDDDGVKPTDCVGVVLVLDSDVGTMSTNFGIPLFMDAIGRFD